MTELVKGKVTKSTIYFCPECGSASLTMRGTAFVEDGQSLAKFSCNVCNWSGGRQDVAAMDVSHEMGSDEEMVRTLITDLKNLLAQKTGVYFAHFLTKWGFLNGTNKSNNTLLLAKYLAVISRKIIEALLLERAEIEKKRINDERKS